MSALLLPELLLFCVLKAARGARGVAIFFLETRMKSFGGLWDRMTSFAHLLAAYRRARRGKRTKPYAIAYDWDHERRLFELQERLRDGTWRPGEYTNFKIHDPKDRLISAAPFEDRIVHHALVAVLEPIWEPRFIFDSYACRRTKVPIVGEARARGEQLVGSDPRAQEAAEARGDDARGRWVTKSKLRAGFAERKPRSPPREIRGSS